MIDVSTLRNLNNVPLSWATPSLFRSLSRRWAHLPLFFPSSRSVLRLRSPPRTIPGIPGQNERYTSEKDASLFLFTIPAATVDGKEQECAYTGIVEAEEWWTMRTAMRLSVEPRKSTQSEVSPPPLPPSTRTK